MGWLCKKCRLMPDNPAHVYGCCEDGAEAGLREKLIEEAAIAMYEVEDLGGDLPLSDRRHFNMAGAALDAMLDTLSENADRWASDGRLLGGDGGMGVHAPNAERLIAALRDTETDPS